MFLTFAALYACNGFAQCFTVDSAPDYSCGTGTPLTNNSNINGNHIYYASGGTYSNINMNGGTMVICGDVTINNINANNVTFLVKPGATVTFNSGLSIAKFHNYGTVVFNSQIQVNGNNAFIYNYQGGVITFNNSTFFMNGGKVVNDGVIVAENGITINSGAICMGDQSILDIKGTLHNNSANAISVRSGNACVSYSGSFQGNQPITNSYSLRLCQLAGANAPSPTVRGGARMYDDCLSCPIILPLKLDYFKGNVAGRDILLEWKTLSEESVVKYEIEASVDQENFSSIGETWARETPGVYYFKTTVASARFFRLKKIMVENGHSYSPIIVVKEQAAGLEVRLRSNPVTGSISTLQIFSDKNDHGYLQIIDQSGVVRNRQTVQLNRGENNILMGVKQLHPGIYYIIFHGTEGMSTPVKMFVQ